MVIMLLKTGGQDGRASNGGLQIDYGHSFEKLNCNEGEKRRRSGGLRPKNGERRGGNGEQWRLNITREQPEYLTSRRKFDLKKIN